MSTKLALLLVAMCCVIPASARPIEKKAGPIVLVHATIINVLDGSTKPQMTVVVEGNRITEVGPDDNVIVPEHSQIIDAGSKYLIPGLWDMHVHLFFGKSLRGGRELTMPLLIANGITGVRDMGSELKPILAARRDVEAGKLTGPRLVIAGPMLDGPATPYKGGISIVVSTPQEARRAVNMLKQAGVDFIKVQSKLSLPVYLAVADEAKKQDITFVGHVPDAVPTSVAVEAGQKSFEHLIGVFEASSTEEEALLTGKKSPGRFLKTYDPARENAIFNLLAAKQVWQTPTLLWERDGYLADVIDVSKDPNLVYVPNSWKKLWPKFTASLVADYQDDDLAMRKRFVDHELGIVRRMHERGIPFLAGTDTPAAIDVLPGFSLHLELTRFVAAGFTPLEALQTATVNPARFLNRLDDMGTIETGKIADMLLLNENPLDDIQNTQKIDTVIANGHLYSHVRLLKILAEARRYSQAH